MELESPTLLPAGTFHIGTFPVKNKKKPIRKRKVRKSTNIGSTGEPLHSALLERFSRVMQACASGNPVDLGPAYPGTLRILVPDYKTKHCENIVNGEWLHNTVHSHDRTVAEWRTLIDEYRKPIFERSIQYKPICDPFAYRSIHAQEMERIVHKNLRIRRFFRYWLSFARKRIMDKRIIGDLDLYTLTPIPEQFCVRVYDVPTSTTYVFHLNTVLRTFLSGLTYNSFGIANPQVPKNPYTNMPWTIGQLISIVQQCAVYKLRAHSFLPFLVQIYRESGYDIKRMYRRNASALNIAAARAFFSNHIDPVVIEMYLEVYDDLEQLIPEKKGMWFVIKRKLEMRKMSAELLAEWDEIIVTYWIFHTFRYVLTTDLKTISDIDEDLVCLYNKTCDWWSKQPRRSIRKRTAHVDTTGATESISHV